MSQPESVRDEEVGGEGVESTDGVRSGRAQRPRVRAPAILAGFLLLSRVVSAQMPGVPVLQNAFSNPGLTVGVDYGVEDGGGDRGSSHSYGAAAAWAPRSGPVQLSVGLGMLTRPGPGSERFPSYGLRLSLPLARFIPRSDFGLAPFAGVGGAKRDSVSFLLIPIGLAGGYRRALGATRALSVYAAPFYGWYRARGLGLSSQSRGLFRVSVGADVAVVSRVGLAVGYEAGSKGGDARPGPAGGIFGAGLSYALR